jgi:hypothetical protein
MKKLFILLFLASGTVLFSQKQDDEEVIAVVKTFFSAMKEADSSKLNSVVHKNIRLQTVGKKKSGEVFVFEEKFDEFVKAVGTPHKETWNEVIHQYDVKIDGPLATVWAPYTFFLGEKLSHCGVNAFQMIKEASGWKIISIIDTRRKDNCAEGK